MLQIGHLEFGMVRIKSSGLTTNTSLQTAEQIKNDAFAVHLAKPRELNDDLRLICGPEPDMAPEPI